VINADNTVTYSPNPDFNGEDSLDYTVAVTNSDGSTTTETATVIITVNPASDVQDDIATTNEDEAVTISVLANDGFNASTEVAVTDVTTPSNGTVVINTDSTVTYTPNADFNGEDSFDYTVMVTNSDGSTTTETATVVVTVNPVSDIQDDIAETINQNPVEIDVLANDTFDTNTDVEVISVTTPANGSVVINSDGTVIYTANEGYYGEDTFEYTVTITNADSSTTTETATVTVTVYLTPFAIDDEVVTDTNIPIDISVLDNDYDEDGTINPESVVIIEEPFNGTVVVNADGTVTYTSDIDYIGDDTFVYQVCDNDGLCDTATVTVIVTGVLAAELNIPQGFSPNGDGVHDTFVITGLTNLYPNFQLQIYNRWGNKVYDYTHNGNALTQPIWWDGFSSGRMNINGKKQVPVGTYFYILHFNKNNAKPRSGYVYLNR
jgi:gliding motility-associated-like protein